MEDEIMDLVGNALQLLKFERQFDLPELGDKAFEKLEKVMELCKGEIHHE